MTTKKKPGRPVKKDKIKTRYIYLTDDQLRSIQGKYKRLTDAILAKCV